MQTQKISGVATKVYTNDQGLTCVQYHNTDVVKFDEAIIVLNTGGWYTATTKTRMNQASAQYDLGYHVSQNDFKWYVTYKGHVYTFDDDLVLLDR